MRGLGGGAGRASDRIWPFPSAGGPCSGRDPCLLCRGGLQDNPCPWAAPGADRCSPGRKMRWSDLVAGGNPAGRLGCEAQCRGPARSRFLCASSGNPLPPVNRWAASTWPHADTTSAKLGRRSLCQTCGTPAAMVFNSDGFTQMRSDKVNTVWLTHHPVGVSKPIAPTLVRYSNSCC